MALKSQLLDVAIIEAAGLPDCSGCITRLRCTMTLRLWMCSQLITKISQTLW